MSRPLKVIFAGTPVFAAYHLEILLQSEHQVIGVLTQPVRSTGRGNKLIPSPVKIIAQKNNIPVFEPDSLKQLEGQHIIKCLNSDIMVVVAYGIILPKKVLNMPRLGCINIHGSLLPRWRGAAPIQRSLCAGDTETGISIIQMDIGIDSGNILYKIPCQITNTDTTDSLYYKLSHLGAQGMLITLDQLANGKSHPQAQDESLATYAKKLSKKEARLDWSLPAIQLERCIRAFNPWPVSYFLIRDQMVKVWQAAVLPYHDQYEIQPGTIIRADKQGIQITTTIGILNLLNLQPADKKAMSVQDLLNSRRNWFTVGTVLP